MSVFSLLQLWGLSVAVNWQLAVEGAIGSDRGAGWLLHLTALQGL